MNFKFWTYFSKKEKLEYPAEFIRIRLNPIAKSMGLNDEFNKEIDMIKNGVVVNTFPYTEKTLKAIKELDEMPIYEEDYSEDEDFEYDSFADLGLVKFKR